MQSIFLISYKIQILSIAIELMLKCVNVLVFSTGSNILYLFIGLRYQSCDTVPLYELLFSDLLNTVPLSYEINILAQTLLLANY